MYCKTSISLRQQSQESVCDIAIKTTSFAGSSSGTFLKAKSFLPEGADSSPKEAPPIKWNRNIAKKSNRPSNLVTKTQYFVYEFLKLISSKIA